MCDFYSPYVDSAKNTISGAWVKKCDNWNCPISICKNQKPDYDILKEMQNLDWSKTEYKKDAC